MINPFSVQAIYEKICANSFMKIDKLDLPDQQAGQRGGRAVLSEHYYITTCANIMRKRDRKMQSPILNEKEATAVADNMRYLTRSMVVMAWAFIPIPLAGALIPFVVSHESHIGYVIALPAAIAGALLVLSQVNFWKFYLKQKELGDQLWARGGTICIPKGFRAQQLRQGARLWAGPASAALLDEAVELVPDDRIKLAYDAITLGSAVIKMRETEA